MRLSARLIPVFLLGAAPQQPAVISSGQFQTWGFDPAIPLLFSASGLTVKVVATPCRTPAQNEGCRQAGVSNQGVVSVSQAGLPRFHMTSGNQASFVRAAVVRLSRRRLTGVVIDNQWGGSAGLTAVTVIEPETGGFRAVPLEYHGSTELIGVASILPSKTLKDDQPAIVLEAPGFNFSGECNACSRGVPIVLTVRNGHSVDVSADPAVRPLFARDLPARRRICLSAIRERNGSCAAFVADAARLGWAASAWRVMLSHYRHEPEGYPAALRSFLVKNGYINTANANALPTA